MIDDVIKVLEAIPEDMECDSIRYIKCPLCGSDHMKIIKSRNGHLHVLCFECSFILHE